MINKADATVTVNGYTGTYDAAPHGATGTATGVGGVDLSAGLNLGATFTDVPGGTAHWTFTGGTNYNNQSGSVAIVINKADATIHVTPYSVTYDANAHTATGSVTGVLGESLAGLDLSGTTHTNASNYTDTWMFTDVTGNYNNDSGTVNDVIGKANATVVVTAYNVTYDSNPHTATYTITGVRSDTGAAGSSINVSGTTHTNTGTYNSDPWSFNGGTNYNNQSGTVNDYIGQANATVTANSTTKTYGQTVTFAGTEFMTSGFLGSDHVTSVTLTSAGAAGTATVTAPGPDYAIVPTAAVGTGLGNYVIGYVNGNLHVNPKTASVTANNRNKTYGKRSHLLGRSSPPVASLTATV